MKNYECEGQMSLFDLADFGVGRTCLEPCQVITEKISAPASKRLQGSKTNQPLYLNLTANGTTPAWSLEEAGRSHGESSMPSMWEEGRRSGEEDCTLSQILMDSVPEKYSLSARACAGILRRAEKRGKILPEILKNALEMQADQLESSSEGNEFSR